MFEDRGQAVEDMRKVVADLEPVSVASSPLIHTPGFLRWAARISDEREALTVLGLALPALPLGLALAVVRGFADLEDGEDGSVTISVAPLED